MAQLTSDELKWLANKGLWFATSVNLHAPLQFAPPVRLYPCTISNQCKIDAFSYVAPNASLHATHIGRYCSIGDHVTILSSHPTDRISSHPFTYENIFRQPFQTPPDGLAPFPNKLPTTTIGHDVWIGAGVRIKAALPSVMVVLSVLAVWSPKTSQTTALSVVCSSHSQAFRWRLLKINTTMVAIQPHWSEFTWDDIHATLDQLEVKVVAGELVPYPSTGLCNNVSH